FENYRGFGKADFDLSTPGTGNPLDVVLLVGGNGSGKTSFLNGVSAVFQEMVDWYGADTFQPEDIRIGSREARIRLSFKDYLEELADQVIEVEAVATRMGPGFTRLARPTLLQEWKSAVVISEPAQTGLITAFDVYRLLPPTAIAGPNIERV